MKNIKVKFNYTGVCLCLVSALFFIAVQIGLLNKESTFDLNKLVTLSDYITALLVYVSIASLCVGIVLLIIDIKISYYYSKKALATIKNEKPYEEDGDLFR